MPLYPQSSRCLDYWAMSSFSCLYFFLIINILIFIKQNFPLMPPQFLLFQNPVNLCGLIDSPLPEKFFSRVHHENFLLVYISSGSTSLNLLACSSSISLLLQDGVYLWQESNIPLAVSAFKKLNLVVINSWYFM